MIFDYPQVAENSASESSQSSDSPSPTPAAQPAETSTNPPPNANGESSTAAASSKTTNADTNTTANANANARPEFLPPGAVSGKRDHTFRMPDETRIEIVRMLIIGWKPQEIAPRLKLSVNSVYNVKKNLMTYGTSIKPKEKESGRPPKMTKEDEEALLAWLIKDGYKEQSDMKDWLLAERGISVERSTLSRILRKRGWSETAVKRMGGKGLEVKKERRRRGPGKKTLMRAGALGEDESPIQQQSRGQHQPSTQAVQPSPSAVGNASRGLPIDPQLGMHLAQGQPWGYGPANG